MPARLDHKILLSTSGFVEGHGFNRAVSATRMPRGLQPLRDDAPSLSGCSAEGHVFNRAVPEQPSIPPGALAPEGIEPVRRRTVQG